MQQFTRVGMMLRKRGSRIGFLSAVLLAAVCGLRTTSGQEYETMPPREETKDWNSADVFRKRLEVLKMLRGQLKADANLKVYFDGYYFPRMTQPDRLSELVNDRQSFSRDVQTRLAPNGSSADAKEAHDALVKLALDRMTEFAASNRKFHPAVRYNAMLLIGELNAEEPLPLGDHKQAAEPLPEALPVLLSAITDANQSDAVRVAALLGVLRHAEREGERPLNHPYRMKALPETKDGRVIPGRSQVVGLMLAIIKGSQPPGTRSTAGQLWMARRAVEALGALGCSTTTPDDREAIARELDAVMKDAKQPMLLRCDAAVALGPLYAPDVNLTKYGNQFARIASQAGHDELNRMLAHQKMIAAKVEEEGPDAASSFAEEGGAFPPAADLSGGLGDEELGDGGLDDDGLGGGDLFGDAYGAMPKVDIALRENYKVDLSRRRLTYYTSCVLDGLGKEPPPKPDYSGASKADKEKDKNKEKEEKKSIKDRIGAVKDAAVKPTLGKNDPVPTPERELQDYIDALRTALQALDTAAKIKAAEPASGAPDGGPVVPSAPAAPSEPPGIPAELPAAAVPAAPTTVPPPGPLGM